MWHFNGIKALFNKEQMTAAVAMNELNNAFKQLCSTLNIHRDLHTSPQHNGSAHVEIVDGEYHYVITERGCEFERRKTPDKDHLLYWLACDLVFSLACQYELKNRIRGQSFRRLLFSKEIELMMSLNKNWAQRRQLEIAKILKESPYNDEKEG